MTDLLIRIAPVVGFLLALTIVAEVADRAGVFDVAGHWAARAARGSVLRLWLLVVLLATCSTIVLSLDTTAVLLTPVVLAITRAAGLDRRLFALTTVWLANTASLLLPVSNLTNLLALHHVQRLPGAPHYVALMWRPALACVLATVVVAGLLHARDLTGRFTTTEPSLPHDRVLLVIASSVCVALAPLFVVGIAPVIPAGVAAVVLVATLAWRDRASVRTLTIPWLTIAGVVVLFVLVDLAGRHGLTGVLAHLTGRGAHPSDLVGLGGLVPSGDLLRFAGVAALIANLGNNLPGYLALEPLAGSSERFASLLVGVNAGSIVTLWGSVATLLWRDRCRRAGAVVPWRTHLWQSALVAIACVVAGVLAI